MTGINRQPSDRELRLFAALQAVFVAVVIVLLARRGVDGIWLAVLVSLSVILLGIGLARPKRIRFVYLGWTAAVFPIGWAVGHVVMAIAYYLVVTPIGLIRRLLGHDRLGRRPDAAATTYWVSREPESSADRAFRQY